MLAFYRERSSKLIPIFLFSDLLCHNPDIALNRVLTRFDKVLSSFTYNGSDKCDFSFIFLPPFFANNGLCSLSVAVATKTHVAKNVILRANLFFIYLFFVAIRKVQGVIFRGRYLW